MFLVNWWCAILDVNFSIIQPSYTMDTKLQELTDKIYREGIEKANEEKGKMLEEAREYASRIREEAEQERSRILDEARKESDGLKERTAAEIRMVAGNALAALKKDIRELLHYAAVEQPVGETLSNENNLKEIIVKALSQLNDDGSAKVMLPDSMTEKARNTVREGIRASLQKEPEIESSSDLFNGFAIRKGETGYYISFTDADFASLLEKCFNEEMNQLLNHED